MNTRTALLGTLLSFVLLIGCGDDSGGSTSDAGEAGTGGGSGGKGGKGGTGGSGGAGGGGSGMDAYTVGGEVKGLSGSGLVLQNNGGDDLKVSSGGEFTFSSKQKSGSDYEVKVLTQPSNPAQNCSVTEGTGSVAKEDVTNVVVTCTTNEYKVGGNVSGLTGTGLVLRNNGGDDLSVSGDGAFSFGAKVKSGADYAVTIKTQPSGQPCALKDATGKVGNADVTNVAVTCLSGLTLQAEASFGKVVTSWNNGGATSYDVYSYSNADCDLEHFDACTDGKKSSNASSPYTVTGLTNGKAYYFRVKGAYSGDVSVVSNQTAARPHRPSFNGDVSAVATHSNGTSYIGGDFSRLTVHTGAAVALNKTTGFASELVNAPIVRGDVNAAAPDGTGGFFIGGLFGRVNEEQGISNLLHVKADGTLDATWTPNPDNQVTQLVVLGNVVYVAGSFTMIGGVARAGLAAVDMTGAVTSWNPSPVPTGSVQVLAVAGSNILAGGAFTTIGGQARTGLAAIDASGAATSWNPGPDGDVVALAVIGDTVYAGGYFSNIGGQIRQRLAAIDASGSAIAAWNPTPNDKVLAIAASANTIYIYGTFTALTGTGGKARHRLAALNSTDGTTTAWNPDPKLQGGEPTIYAINVVGDTVYLAGDFTNVGGADRNAFAAIDAAGVATSWNPNPDGLGVALAASGDVVYIGGQFDGLGGVTRAGLAAFDATGAPTDWNPGVKNGNVNALAVLGDTVYVGGAFDDVGGMGRNKVAAVDLMGAVTSWNPNADGNVQTLAVSGSTIYVGGEFGNIGGAARSRAAALGANGTATAWNPDADGTVRAFAFDGTTVYAGGDFTHIGGQARNHVAALDGSAAATNWDPNANGKVQALAFSNAKVYVGGEFSMIGGAVRNRLASVDAAGTATAWDPNAMDIVRVLGFVDDRLYAAGDFSLIGTVSRNHIAAFDGNGDLTTWAPNIEGSVLSFAFTSTAVKTGGAFLRVDGLYEKSFVSLMKSE